MPKGEYHLWWCIMIHDDARKSPVYHNIRCHMDCHREAKKQKKTFYQKWKDEGREILWYYGK